MSTLISSNAALLILAHGSPRPESNKGLYEIAQICRARNLYASVTVGFLECNEPSIPDAIDSCCAGVGVSSLVVVPYFLHTGTHVADDLPTLVEEGRLRHPGIEFRMGEFLGRSSYVTDILGDRIDAVFTTLDSNPSNPSNPSNLAGAEAAG